MQPSLLFTDTLYEKLDYLVNTLGVKNFVLYVHPYVSAYLKKGFPSLYRRWQMKFGFRFRILPDESLAYLAYKVLDAERNEIDLKEEKDMASSATKQKQRNSSRDRQNED